MRTRVRIRMITLMKGTKRTLPLKVRTKGKRLGAELKKARKAQEKENAKQTKRRTQTKERRKKKKKKAEEKQKSKIQKKKAALQRNQDSEEDGTSPALTDGTYADMSDENMVASEPLSRTARRANRTAVYEESEKEDKQHSSSSSSASAETGSPPGFAGHPAFILKKTSAKTTPAIQTDNSGNPLLPIT